MTQIKKGGFTLPGEAGYEKETLELAERWGADVIRDSDGTKLSREIMDAGYGIYSTICIIRGHNEWLRSRMDRLQQSFLMSEPKTAREEGLEIDPMEGYFREQFMLNDSQEALEFWQVFDRTENRELPLSDWQYQQETQRVILSAVKPGHTYTVNFLAYRIWEEINMYNHVTNNWQSEHLMPIDPRYPDVQEYLLNWLENWCQENPDTTVVRFTSLFYNFVWIWGESDRRRNRFTDWGSYDFTVSPRALHEFEQAYGYALTAEDFIHQGKLHPTHLPPNKKQLDYMAFTNAFVLSFGRKLVDLVHRYGKKAYVFYDDSWVGLEPYFATFPEFGFDGLIKCIFSAYEVRLCAGAQVPVHEVRLHPYLFPVGLGGAPTFSEGGDPVLDAKKYWSAARRAMLRCKIDRIGLGGYLHLLEGYPDFVDYIAETADEFRLIRSLHETGHPEELPLRIGVLTAWGKVRSWTLSGHFHETWQHDLIHINEALAGWPVEVEYLDFQEIKTEDLSQFDVIINAGCAGSAWSGGDAWKDDQVVERLTAYVQNGGCFLGIHQPSMTEGYYRQFRMAEVLGVDQACVRDSCHGGIRYELDLDAKSRVLEGLSPEGQAGVLEALEQLPETEGIYLTSLDTRVLTESVAYSPIGEQLHTPKCTLHSFGRGVGIYLSHFCYSLESSRFLLNLLLDISGKQAWKKRLGDNPACEIASFPEARKLVAINGSDQPQIVSLELESGVERLQLPAYGSVVRDV